MPILYRTNAQSNALEYAFKRNSIPYRIIGGTRFFDRAEVKDMLAYLCVINNRADDLRLLRIINNPPRGIGAKTIEMASAAGRSGGRARFITSSPTPYSYPSLEKAAAKLMAFTVLIEDCAELLKTLQSAGLLRRAADPHRLCHDAGGKGRCGIAHPARKYPQSSNPAS